MKKNPKEPNPGNLKRTETRVSYQDQALTHGGVASRQSRVNGAVRPGYFGYFEGFSLLNKNIESKSRNDSFDHGEMPLLIGRLHYSIQLCN
jgi:hypothetical protein